MNKNKRGIISGVGVAALIAVVSFGIAFAEGNHGNGNSDNENGGGHEEHARVCPRGGSPDSANCHARVIVDSQGLPKSKSTPSGFGPAQFRGAYGVSGITSSNQTIAIVDAYDHPNILSDLNNYSATFGIPSLKSCSVGTGTTNVPCFQKVNQRGGTTYPTASAGWALEISLDVEAAHALCQNCNILLVEADSASFANLIAAEDEAAAMGVKTISNSWGGNEFSAETSSEYDGHFNKPGVAITVSSGDSGYGTEYPAASQYVTAVGGTSLTVDSGNNRTSERAWSGAGSGCSAYEPKPLWQVDALCANRTVADVSADADPNTGAAVYDSVRYQGRSGWFKVGGTSLSSPLIAATYALAGNVNLVTPANQLPYVNSANLHDITSGSNGSCGGTYLCTAVLGYDGPTGLGTPSGSAGF